MIAALSGRVLAKGMDRAVIDVSGVGYEVHLSSDALSRLPDGKQDAFLHVHTHVREDAIVLYGFLAEEEKELFLKLTSVSGVGPKLGLAALSAMRVADLCRAIVTRDSKMLTAIPGVGKKMAERICMELKDKISPFGTGDEHLEMTATSGPTPGTSSPVMDALSALTNLGYSDPVCRQALTAVKKRVGDETFYGLAVEDLIRECLRTLA